MKYIFIFKFCWLISYLLNKLFIYCFLLHFKCYMRLIGRALQQLVAPSVSDQRQRVAPAGPGSRRPINPAGPGPAAPPGGARILTQPIPGGWADPARGPRATLWPGRRSNGTPHRLDQSFGGSESDERAPGRRGGKAWVARRDHLSRPQSTPRWTLFPNGMKFGPTCVQLFGGKRGQILGKFGSSDAAIWGLQINSTLGTFFKRDQFSSTNDQILIQFADHFLA